MQLQPCRTLQTVSKGMATLGTKYTDTLQVEQQPAQQMNALGDLVSSPAEWLSVSLCREEPSAAGSEVSGVGATAIVWSSEIFMPPTCPRIANKTLVRVLNAAGEVQVTGRVLRFKKYKHYAKLWI